MGDFHTMKTDSWPMGYSFLVNLRPARDQDSAGIIDLIGRIFAEYPNCHLLVDLEEPKLRTPASSYQHFWILEEQGKIHGCIACGAYPVDSSSTKGGQMYFELQKLYMDASLRRQGWGRRLVEKVEAMARAEGFERIELWTDTKFATAHKVYAILGYQASGRTRELNDVSETSEYHYFKDL